MKKMMIVTIATLICTNALAATNLTCLVHKFKGTFNMSDDNAIIFKGAVESGKIILVDAKGKVKLADKAVPTDARKYLVFAVNNLWDLVMVSSAQQESTAQGKDAAGFVDHKNGISVTCSMQQD